MNLSSQVLADTCSKLISAYQKGKNWIQEGLPEELKMYASIEIKRFIREMSKLQKASINKPAVAVFGASQMGKSYLVSNMVKPSQVNDLFIKDPITGHEISFIQEMNPFGSKESTGTVTRFTNSSNSTVNKGYAVKLLSPRDLVCIITNGYLNDIQEHNFSITIEELTKHLAGLNSRAQKAPTGIFEEDDFQQIKDYIFKSMGAANNIIIHKLTELDFWTKAGKLAPFLSIAEAVELSSYLWGKQPFLNGLFQRLLQGLYTLKFNYSIFCDKHALTPNTETILDVQRVRELFINDNVNNSSVKITTHEGQEEMIDRRILAALTAEVELPISLNEQTAQERKFLEYADVLDFPGARSRERVPEAVFSNNPDDAKLQLFVRGKVAYLFDLYNQDYGISTLLYCMDDSNPEVQSLPDLLYQWIESSIGKDPQDRETRIVNIKNLLHDNRLEISPLLVVFTKFDIELAGKPSEILWKPETHDGKWVARFEENFKNFMQRPVDDKWISRWTQSQPNFKHIFPIYDPKYPNPVYERGSDNEEISVSQSFKQKLEDMKTSFISHPAVQNHVIDPIELWQEIAPPGKTGIDYIIEYLTPTCKPEIKIRIN